MGLFNTLTYITGLQSTREEEAPKETEAPAFAREIEEAPKETEAPAFAREIIAKLNDLEQKDKKCIGRPHTFNYFKIIDGTTTPLNKILASKDKALIKDTLTFLAKAKRTGRDLEDYEQTQKRIADDTGEEAKIGKNRTLREILVKKDKEGKTPLLLLIETKDEELISQYLDFLLDDDIFPDASFELKELVISRDNDDQKNSALQKITELNNANLVNKFVAVLKRAGHIMPTASVDYNEHGRSKHNIWIESERKKQIPNPAYDDQAVHAKSSVLIKEIDYKNKNDESAEDIAYKKNNIKIGNYFVELKNDLIKHAEEQHVKGQVFKLSTGYEISEKKCAAVGCTIILMLIAFLLADYHNFFDMEVFFENDSGNENPDASNNLLTTSYDGLNVSAPEAAIAEELLPDTAPKLG